jgi:O-antigen/teichoic acid export membrane protein
MIARVLGAVTGFLLTIYAARVMGIEDAGRFFWASNVVLGFGFVSKWGLEIVMTRLVALDKNNSERTSALLWQGMILTGGTAILITAISLVLAQVFKEKLFPDMGYIRVFVLAMFCLVPFSLQAPVCGVLRGQQKQGEAAFVEKTGQSVFLLIIMFLLAQLGMINAETALWANILVCTAVLLIGIYITKAFHIKKADRNLSLKIHPEIITGGGALVINNLAGFLVNWGCGIMLAWYVAADEVAVFVSAQRISSSITIVFAIFAATYGSFMPLLYAERKFDELSKLIIKGTRNLMLASMPFVFFMLVLPSEAMRFMGENYVHGSKYLVCLVMGQIFTILTGLAGLLLAMAGKEHVMRNIGIGVAVFMIVFGWLVIPRFGSMGAAIVTSVGMLIQGAMYVYMVEVGLGVKYLRK